eukprot:scaffold1193_cov159-Ochromonas_danica.AAC.8
MLNAELSPEDSTCLDDFSYLRTKMARDLGHRDDDRLPPYRSVQAEDVGTHELLITEADYLLALADEQYEEGLRFEAMLNYHTACVFYRVMETMIPSKASSLQHSKLMYAAQRVRQTSSLYMNFVRENFTGGSCSEVYEVHGSSKLGKGSYGSVYLATHRLTGDERAVKVMNVDRITSYYLRKLHTEISILKSLDHPNIVKLQDVFFGKRSVYIVTDLCRGGELFELLNSGKNQGFVFREDRASKLMRDMLSAVNYLHENGIVHRDLKLENFLFEDHNPSSPLILIDFGLSKHFSRDEKLSQKVGSCYYTAPEVLNGNYDHRCDIWSLGVLCYMLLSGSPPFYGKSVEDVYQAILTKEPSFNDKKFKHVSNACMDFMKRLLTREPRQRLTTAEALSHPFITGAAFYPRYPTLSLPSFGASGANNSSSVSSGRAADVQAETAIDLAPGKAAQILESMLFFAKADRMSRLVMNMVSHTLGPLELQQFREEFQAIDRSYTGAISRRDFLAAFSSADHNIDLKSLFETLSVVRSLGHSQGLTYHEYVAACMRGRVRVTESRLSLIFTYLDPENKGHLSAAGLQSALGEEVPVRQIEEMIDVCDSDGDRALTKNDLLSLWNRVWGTSNGSDGVAATGDYMDISPSGSNRFK